MSTLTSTDDGRSSLGLDFEHIRIHDSGIHPPVETPENRENENIFDEKDLPPELVQDSQDEATKLDSNAELKEKKKPYVNPERVKTGGTQRVSDYPMFIAW